MDYERIDNVTFADVAVRVRASRPDELFIKGGAALISEMVENSKDIVKSVSREGEIEGNDLSFLYFDFLNEILFFKDAESLLLLPENVDISEVNGIFICRYILKGEKISHDKHFFNVDIKAITMHHLKVYVENDIYIAEAVFDA